jgi:hypothetical protein
LFVCLLVLLCCCICQFYDYVVAELLRDFAERLEHMFDKSSVARGFSASAKTSRPRPPQGKCMVAEVVEVVEVVVAMEVVMAVVVAVAAVVVAARNENGTGRIARHGIQLRQDGMMEQHNRHCQFVSLFMFLSLVLCLYFHHALAGPGRQSCSRYCSCQCSSCCQGCPGCGGRKSCS